MPSSSPDATHETADQLVGSFPQVKEYKSTYQIFYKNALSKSYSGCWVLETFSSNLMDVDICVDNPGSIWPATNHK